MPLATIYNKTCACFDNSLPVDNANLIDAFYQLRKMCPVLKLTIADEIEKKHKLFTKSEPDEANHCSIPFLAYRDGYLAEFTEALHRFVLDGNECRVKVTAQYKKDLRETWVLEIDENSRYKKARNYLSRLAELHFARWLETHQWQVHNLELYGGQFDVEGIDSNQVDTAFEIKFFGEREVLFELIRDSYTNAIVGRLGVYSPIDYLIFRVYEAARQLQSASTHRIAVVVLSDYNLSYKIPLSEGWVDWANPSFLKRDPEIQDFLDRQYTKNPDLDADLKTFITGLNEIWIMRYKSKFGLHLEHCIQVSRA